MTNAPVPVTCLCLSIDDVIPFLRSVSYAQVAQRTTRIEWAEETEGALPVLYAALLGTFGTPGTARVVTAPEARIRDEVIKETQRRINLFFQKCEAGPGAVAAYLAEEEEMRTFCLKALRDLHAEANAINAEIVRAWGKAISFVSHIKLGSTLAMKAMGQIPGPGWAVGFAYDVTVGTIDDLAKADRAKAVVVVASENALKEGMKEVAGQVAEKTVDVLNRVPTDRELGQALTRMRQLDDKLGRQLATLRTRGMERSLGWAQKGTEDSIRSLTSQVARNTDKLDAAQRAVVKAGAKRIAAKLVGWAFLADDVREAFAKHSATTAAAAQ